MLIISFYRFWEQIFMKLFKRAFFLIIAIFAVLLTTAEAGEPPPYWIVYQVSDFDNLDFHIHRMAPDGSQDQFLTDVAASNSFPTWSPDGEWIAFMGYDAENGLAVYKMRPDGSDLQQLTTQFGTTRYTEWTVYLEWSPDSQWIVFGARQSQQLVYDNFIINLEDVEEVALLHASYHPMAWSPDSQYLIFVIADTPSNDIVRLPLLDTSYERLSTPDIFPRDPQYAPDGEWIAFVALADGNRNLYRMRSDGSDLQQLTTTMTDVLSFEWSPNSQWITFENDPKDGLLELYVSRADGSEQRLIHEAEAFFDPIWSTDGEWIFFDVLMSPDDTISNADLDIYRIRPDGSDLSAITSGSPDQSYADFSPILEQPSSED